MFQPAQSQETLNKNYEQKYNQYASEHQYVNTNPTAPQSTSTSQEPTTPKYTINPQYKTAPQNSIKPQYEQSLENYRDSTLDEIRRMIWFKQNEVSILIQDAIIGLASNFFKQKIRKSTFLSNTRTL